MCIRDSLLDRGAIAPGKTADFLLLSDLDGFSVASTYKNGNCIWSRGQVTAEQTRDMRFPEPYYHSIRLDYQEQSRFAVPMEPDSGTVRVRVMEIQDGSTRTTEKILDMPVKDGILQWEDSGCLLAAVFERYGKGRAVGYGLLTGDCNKRGAVATSYAHDS